MNLDSLFLLPEQSPLKGAETQINCCGVKDICSSSEFEYLNNSALLGFCHNPVGELLEDAAVSVNIRFGRLLLVATLPKPRLKASFACAYVARTRSLKLSRLDSCPKSLLPTAISRKGLDILVTPYFFDIKYIRIQER